MKQQMRTKVGVLVALVLVVFALPTTAATRQMDAADEPEVSGPLELSSDDCRREEETDDQTGEVIARGKTCLRVYSYDPASETDSERNYGVVWLQSNVDSRAGWCAAKALSDIDLPSVVEVESKKPRSMELSKRRAYTTRLTADAAGNGADVATVRQGQILYPNAIRTTVNADTNVFRLRWTGLKDKKLGFASGAEISWPVDEEPRITFRLNYELKNDDC